MKAYSVNVDMEVDISNEELVRILKQRISDKQGSDYKVVDNKLFRYERCSWNDYDYIEVSDLDKITYNRILKETLSKDTAIKHIHKVFGLDIQGKEK